MTSGSCRRSFAPGRDPARIEHNKEVGAVPGALDSSRLSDHGDAIDMERTSRFVKKGKETLYPTRKPLARHWFHREPLRGRRVEDAYPVLLSGQFRDTPTPRRLQTACRMDLASQAQALGILTEFTDGQGRRHVTDDAALKIIVDAFPIRTPRRFIDGPAVIRVGLPGRTELRAAARLPVRWKIEGVGPTIAEGVTDDHSLLWPEDLPLGTWRLRITDASGDSEEGSLIVAPQRACTGDFDRSWVIAVQLYSVRSARNWGMGDFTDLESLVRLASQFGADGIGLNPLHALFDDRPGDCSPYSPNSRLFLNALYIDAENIPGYQPMPEGDAIARLQQNAVVDYPAVATLKWQALRSAFEHFSKHPDAAAAKDFDAFRAERGTLLSHFACFEVFRRKFKTPWWE